MTSRGLRRLGHIARHSRLFVAAAYGAGRGDVGVGLADSSVSG
jgi:hypothetical protein